MLVFWSSIYEMDGSMCAVQCVILCVILKSVLSILFLGIVWNYFQFSVSADVSLPPSRLRSIEGDHWFIQKKKRRLNPFMMKAPAHFWVSRILQVVFSWQLPSLSYALAGWDLASFGHLASLQWRSQQPQDWKLGRLSSSSKFIFTLSSLFSSLFPKHFYFLPSF
jgi:hypothetical protein